MTTKSYVINFTDPSKSTITVPAGDSFGPYSNTRFTDIELLGMGHTFWGEKMNENILHMLENFASNEDLHTIDSVSIPDTFVVAGKDVTKSFVASTNIEIINSANNNGSYPVVSSNFNGTDTTIVISGVIDAVTPLGSAGEAGVPDKSSDFSPITAITGQLWYNQTTGKLLTFNQTGSPLTSGVGDWKPLNNFFVSSSTPSGASEGDFWWDTTVYLPGTDSFGRNLNVFVSGWKRVVDNYLPRDGSKLMIGDLNMGGKKIIAVGNATAGTEALNRTTGDSRYVKDTGDTMSGVLNMNAQIDMNAQRITAVGNATAGTDALNRTTGDSRYVKDTGDTMSGVLNMNAQIDMNAQRITAVGNAVNSTDALNSSAAASIFVQLNGGAAMTGRLTLAADPINNLHAATKQYVDSNTATVGIKGIVNPTEFSTPVIIANNYATVNSWTTHSIGVALANAQYVMVVADTYYIVVSSGNTSLRVFGRDPAAGGVANTRWMFAYSGGNPSGVVYLTGSGTTILKTGGPASNPTIELLAVTDNGNIAASVGYRIVAWW